MIFDKKLYVVESVKTNDFEKYNPDGTIQICIALRSKKVEK
jgi:hypothetical protein